MATPPGGGYPGPPSVPTAPSAPPAPGSYPGQQGWQQPNYGSTPSSYSSAYSTIPASYSTAPPSTYSTAPPSTYSTAPPSTYGTSAPSLGYSNSIRAQYNSQGSFSSAFPPAAAPYSDPQQQSVKYGQSPAAAPYSADPQQQSVKYGQSHPPSSYGHPTPQPPAGYSQTSSYSDPSKLASSYQSQPTSNYVQPAPPASYGQAPLSSYGQAPNTSYGLPQPTPHGKPGSQPTTYGQPTVPHYGQTYGQYSSPNYPPAYGTPYGQQQYSAGKPKVQFPSGTDPEVIRAFELGDIDGSGLIDAVELGRVLSTGLPFSLRTVHLMLHLYSANGSEKIGPTEFEALWIALKEWKACFERSDRDRSGRIDFQELRDGLLSMGYSISPPLLQILISKYDRTGQAKAIDYDNFVECGLVVKGLTDRFKAKDTRFTGSATLDYETFMSMVLPFIVA